MPHFGLLDLRFIDSKPIIDFMGRLGVLFLLFYLGLEFSLGRLLRAGYSIATAGTIYIVINLMLGLLFGWVLGWPTREILVVAGITTISSSAIVAKVITDLRRSARPETGLIAVHLCHSLRDSWPVRDPGGCRGNWRSADWPSAGRD